MADVQDRIKELQKPMLKKRLYVVFSTPVRPIEEMTHVLPDHPDYMIELEKRGLLFASGPFLGEEGGVSGRGMTILRSDSKEEAEELASGDPLHKAGIRTFEVEEWQLMEGSFSVRVNYSDGSYTVE
jgi:uncharacterized protein YciI